MAEPRHLTLVLVGYIVAQGQSGIITANSSSMSFSNETLTAVRSPLRDVDDHDLYA